MVAWPCIIDFERGIYPSNNNNVNSKTKKGARRTGYKNIKTPIYLPFFLLLAVAGVTWESADTQARAPVQHDLLICVCVAPKEEEDEENTFIYRSIYRFPPSFYFFLVLLEGGPQRVSGVCPRERVKFPHFLLVFIYFSLQMSAQSSAWLSVERIELYKRNPSCVPIYPEGRIFSEECLIVLNYKLWRGGAIDREREGY